MYSAMPAMQEHQASRAWLEQRFRDHDCFVGLCWPVIYSFVRLVSNPRIMGDDAVSIIDAWSAAHAFRRQPTARLVEAGDHHHAIASELMATPGLAARDVPDVQVATHAIEHGLTLCTHDHGFGRFAGLRWIDPLAG